MTRSFLIIIFSIILIGCGQNDEKLVNSSKNEETIVVDSEFLKDVTYESLVEEVKYLTLETTEDNLFGEITKVCFDDNKIFVLDRNIFKGVLVFSDDGNFLFSLKQGGGSEQNFEQINSFTIDKHRKQIKILAASSIISFSYEGRFIKREEMGFLADNFELLDDLFAFVGTEHALITSDSLFEIEKRYFPWEENYLLGLIQPFEITQDGILYRHSLSDTIYLVKNDRIIPHRIFDFLDKKVTKSELERVIETQERRPFPEKMHSIKYYSETEEIIYFAFKYQSRIVTSYFDKRSNKTISFFADEIDNNVTFEPTTPLIVGIKDNLFVASVDLEGVNVKSMDYSSNKYLRLFLDESVGKDISKNPYNPMLVFIKMKNI